MKFSKLAMAAATSVASLASAQLIPFDITGSGGDSFDYPFSATGVPNTITVDSFFVNGGAGTQAVAIQIFGTPLRAFMQMAVTARKTFFVGWCVATLPFAW